MDVFFEFTGREPVPPYIHYVVDVVVEADFCAYRVVGIIVGPGTRFEFGGGQIPISDRDAFFGHVFFVDVAAVEPLLLELVARFFDPPYTFLELHSGDGIGFFQVSDVTFLVDVGVVIEFGA